MAPALLLFLAVLLPLASALPRGVDPQFAPVFIKAKADGTFKCLDGSRTIPYSRVNDNYCDCLTDGSDEPGTSACYHGKFYCASRGYQPQVLSSAFVDDGICDCCDGADEQPGMCKNTCLDKGAKERQKVREDVDKMRRSLDLKRSLTEQGAQRRQGWGGRKGAVAQELAAKQEEVARLEEEKKQKEAAAEADRQRIRAEQEEAERQRQADVAAQQAAEAEQQRAEDAAHDAGAEQVEETDEERGRRIASQWTSDPEAAGVPAPADDGSALLHAGEGEPEEEDQGEHHEYNHYDQQHHQQPPAHQPYVYTPLDNEVHTVNAQLEAAKRRLEELQEEQRVIERYHSSGIKYDFGPNDLFASLAGRCLSDVGQRWTYEACFFEQAVQKEPHNPSNRVSLGVWSHWNKDYTEAVFAGGDPCSGGVTRSLTVKLVCDEHERMWGGEEPAMCVYHVWFATPLACRHSDLQQELDKLEALEKFEAEIRAEIEAAERAAAASVTTHTEL